MIAFSPALPFNSQVLILLLDLTCPSLLKSASDVFVTVIWSVSSADTVTVMAGGGKAHVITVLVFWWDGGWAGIQQVIILNHLWQNYRILITSFKFFSSLCKKYTLTRWLKTLFHIHTDKFSIHRNIFDPPPPQIKKKNKATSAPKITKDIGQMDEYDSFIVQYLGWYYNRLLRAEM